VPRATVTTQSTYALSVLVANGPFLAMHPSAMLTTPNEQSSADGRRCKTAQDARPNRPDHAEEPIAQSGGQALFALPPTSARRYLAQAHRCEIRADLCLAALLRLRVELPCRAARAGPASN
jgi:hypothetical protein